MSENSFDHFTIKNNEHEDKNRVASRAFVYDAIEALMYWTKQQIKDLQDAQAHQQSKERRREERLAESEERFENPYHGGQEDGQEDEEVQGKTFRYVLDITNVGVLAKSLAQLSYNAHGDRDACEYIGSLKDGQNYRVRVEFE